jgi:hypothetical protein
LPGDILARYVDACASDLELRGAARQLVLPPTYAASFGDLLLDRPMFVAEREVTSFADDLAALFGILVSIPGILFDGDLRRYCSALGMDDGLA